MEEVGESADGGSAESFGASAAPLAGQEGPADRGPRAILLHVALGAKDDVVEGRPVGDGVDDNAAVRIDVNAVEGGLEAAGDVGVDVARRGVESSPLVVSGRETTADEVRLVLGEPYEEEESLRQFGLSPAGRLFADEQTRLALAASQALQALRLPVLCKSTSLRNLSFLGRERRNLRFRSNSANNGEEREKRRVQDRAKWGPRCTTRSSSSIRSQ